jgi:putative NIF3 family GTP cyclohydrolase 1 type 2
MKRRAFISTTTWFALGSLAPVFPSRAFADPIVTAADMQRYLRSLVPVHEPSVDRIVIGDPETKIYKVGTCWQPYFRTIEEAGELGVNLLIVHEPTFYTHWDLDQEDSFMQNIPSPAREKYQEAIRKKRQWIEEHEMVIIRSHDVPDILKGFGIPFALGQALGYDPEDLIEFKDYYNVYRVEPDTAWNISRKIASSLMVLNQPGVAFYGDRERVVSSVGLGTGCICDPVQYQELEPDLSIAIDDTVRTWTQTTFAEDTGDPLVVINHGTSEEMGMRLLNRHLKEKVPGLEFIHFNQGCTYRWITGI